MSWAPDYATTAQVKAFANPPITDTADDAEIATAISAASRAIDRACFRQFGKTDDVETRVFTAKYNRHRARPAWVVEIDDVATTTGLVVSVNGIEVTDYALEPRNAVLKGKVWTSLLFGPNAEAFPTNHAPEVEITATWGWSSVPTTILNACKLQTMRFFKRRNAVFGVAGSPEMGSELRLLERIDADVRVQITDYIRPWGAV